jgi:hypothetical protein
MAGSAPTAFIDKPSGVTGEPVGVAPTGEVRSGCAEGPTRRPQHQQESQRRILAGAAPKALIATLAALACLGYASAPASATRINECGNRGVHSDGHFGWGRGPVSGAGDFNLTTRRVSCRRARRFVNHYRGTLRSYPGVEFTGRRAESQGSRRRREPTGTPDSSVPGWRVRVRPQFDKP